ncbi:MAG TPA: pentapeptide repeat-containing protein [Caulobacteraceae bacterium]|jgi:uncharacterized protein YjbI with pentapeptide repeats|nr:pentapeptide repeat-containing protein [Caulobacteraceae bacterium]
MKLLAFAALISLAASPTLAQNAAQVARAEGGASCPGCNLFQANLYNKDLRGRNYAGARLRQADMSLSVFNHVSFAGGDLRDVNGYGALFSGANLKNVNLTNATLVGSYLQGANFRGAKLDGVNFSGAEMDKAVGLRQAQLAHACGDASTTLPRGLHLPDCK